MKTNVKARVKLKPTEMTFEGAPAFKQTDEEQLMRAVMCCMLWEDGFYESGESIADRIKKLVPKCRPEFVAACAYHARTEMNMRHAPLLLVREMARHNTHKHLVAKLLPDVIQRADELAEFLSIYWETNDGKKTLSAQIKKGLGTAFAKFNEYNFGKYKGTGNKVTLRDALFLSHANPCAKGASKYTKVERKFGVPRTLNEKEALYKKITDNTLDIPNTWETRLSSGEDKKEVFTDLIKTRQLGGLAFLRNLRNMEEAGVERALIVDYFNHANFARVLPFRFIAARNAAPSFQAVLEAHMLVAMEGMKKLEGKTIIAVDNSGSMYARVSSRSDIQRVDAAIGLAMMGRELCKDIEIIGFGTGAKVISPYRGFALEKAIKEGPDGGTETDKALRLAESRGYDRIIVITDGQSCEATRKPLTKLAYEINVASYANSVLYKNWLTISGWSEKVFSFIAALEEQVNA